MNLLHLTVKQSTKNTSSSIRTRNLCVGYKREHKTLCFILHVILLVLLKLHRMPCTKLLNLQNKYNVQNELWPKIITLKSTIVIHNNEKVTLPSNALHTALSHLYEAIHSSLSAFSRTLSHSADVQVQSIVTKSSAAVHIFPHLHKIHTMTQWQ